MLGDNLRKALSNARISPQEAADKMGISKGSLYNLFKKDSFEVDYLRRASEITGIPIYDFFDGKSEILNSRPKDEKIVGAQTIDQMTRNIEEIKALFEEEIRAKNQLINKLVDLLGKLEGAIKNPHSTDYFDNIDDKVDVLKDLGKSMLKASA